MSDGYIGNGDHVTRREMHLTLAPLQRDITEIKDDVRAIHDALGAGPRWLGNRANSVIDKFLPTALLLAALYLFGDKVTGG